MTLDSTKIMRSMDRLLPTQERLNDNYKESSSEYFCRLHDLLLSFNKNEHNNFDRFDVELPVGLSYFQMGSDLPSLYFLQFMVKLGNYKNILEIGTFIGMSAMHLADATSGGHVTTVEVGKDFYELAKKNVSKNGYADKVTVLHANASNLINILPDSQTFDLIYLDGDKGNYCNLFKLLLPLLSTNGLFVIDDVLFNGDVLNNNPVTEKGKGVKDVLDEVATRNDVEAFLLPLSNGKLLIRRS